MKQQDVFRKIGIIIKELNDQYGYLSETQNELNDLELELFVANARFLADHSEVLQKLNLQNTPAPVTAPAPEVKKEEKYFEPVVQQAPPVVEPKEEQAVVPTPHTASKPIKVEVTNKPVDNTPVPHIDLGGNGADDDFSYVRREPETIRHELSLEDIPNWEDDDDEGFVNEELLEEPVKKPIEEPAKVVKPEPIKESAPVEAKVEHAHEEPMTINQRISAQLNHNPKPVEHSNLQPISDLKQAITLNDKLLYIKDLFNGYNLAYSEAIDLLNRYTSFEEAEKFLQASYVTKNDWASKQATADKFYELIKRRYL